MNVINDPNYIYIPINIDGLNDSQKKELIKYLETYANYLKQKMILGEMK